MSALTLLRCASPTGAAQPAVVTDGRQPIAPLTCGFSAATGPGSVAVLASGSVVADTRPRRHSRRVSTRPGSVCSSAKVRRPACHEGSCPSCSTPRPRRPVRCSPSVRTRRGDRQRRPAVAGAQVGHGQLAGRPGTSPSSVGTADRRRPWRCPTSVARTPPCSVPAGLRCSVARLERDARRPVVGGLHRARPVAPRTRSAPSSAPPPSALAVRRPGHSSFSRADREKFLCGRVDPGEGRSTCQ